MAFKQRIACENFNHGRARVSVRYCPNCGGVVNESLPIGRCTESTHAAARRDTCAFCTDCGLSLALA